MPPLEKWTPLYELDRMERRMRRLFEEAGFFPTGHATNVYETDDEYVVEVEAPGFAERELEVEVTDHTLVIKGAHEKKTEEQEKTLLLRERLESEFIRRFQFPPIGDTEHVTADFAQGVLTLHVPKLDEAKPRKIVIGQS